MMLMPRLWSLAVMFVVFAIGWTAHWPQVEEKRPEPGGPRLVNTCLITKDVNATCGVLRAYFGA